MGPDGPSIIWGLYHGSLLVIERLAGTYLHWRPSGLPGVAASFFLVMVGWVFFRAPTLDAALHFLAAMFGFGTATESYYSVASYLSPDILCYLALGLIFAFAPLETLSRLRLDRIGVMALQLLFSLLSLAYSMLLLSANSFNPFIYFRF